ncbi:maltase-glucoamylase, intestinal-like [Dendronephthya gigantea]|uniref:maltase-glucoamylase, intestinal-like n=1 Tax=Dendronephthya gigantea TaxID=151771 RepID=UPI00106DC203|nr:maltase-glucoamylase, intestinal-like [Dendronephthya gigantea]
MVFYLRTFTVLILVAFGCHFIEANDEARFDCYPERLVDKDAVNKTLCEKRGCIWKKPGKDQNAPSCYYPANFNGYRLIKKKHYPENRTRIYSLRREAKTVLYGNHSENISVHVQFSHNDVLRIKIVDSHEKRYEVPVSISPSHEGAEPVYDIQTVDYPFSLKITRKSDKEVLWDTSVAPIIFSDQYIQISTKLPSKYLYGFGEDEHETFHRSLDWQTLGMFSRDQFPFAAPQRNVYGVHPFYMSLEESSKAHGVVLINSNAMDVTLQPTPALTYRTIGGILDFYMFFGPTPEQVVQQYTKLIGRTIIPPYWSLGFQLCRYGYKNLDEVKNVVSEMKKYGIPQDVQYGDIDYMERQLDFTYDKNTFKGLPEFVDSIKKDGLKYIIILDPAISANETKPYPPYSEGVKEDVWIKNNDGEILFGKVWPDYPNVTDNASLSWDERTKRFRAFVAFPDYFAKNTTKWWKSEIEKFHNIVDFDGLWIDMNEPANFVHGSTKGCPNNRFDYPPYKPYVIGNVLADKTVCMSATQGGGLYRHYDVHSLYGWSQTIVTQPIVQSVTGKRSIVISRSTYPSSGKYAGHWLGDNLSQYYQMHRSIVGMLDFSLFGIPYIGADICGFIDNTTPRLCQRWMQLGAFYPFSRNHNAIGNQPQHPTVFGEEIARNSRDILLVRYRLLPYLYTLFYEAHTKGSTVVRPLLNEFTSDKKTWTIDKQFLWGPALLVSPAMEKNQTKVKAYFPGSRWFDYFTREEVPTKKGYHELQTPQDHINLHLRGGYVIPIQEPANNTFFSRRNSFGLIVSLDDNGLATGSMFWDDGDSVDSVERKNFLLLRFNVTENKLSITVEQTGFAVEPRLENILVLGLKDGKVKASDGISVYHEETKSLNITRLNWKLNETHVISWSTNSTTSTTPTSHGYTVKLEVYTHLLSNTFVVFIAFLMNKYLY